MNLYDYFEEKIHKDKVKEYNGDMYEMALVRYVMKEASRLFYRDYTFFLYKENIKDRDGIYNKKIDLNDVKDFSIVCKSYCDVIRNLLKNTCGIEAEEVSAFSDKFRHLDLMIKTKSGNKYIVDPLTDLVEMQVGLRTNNFASKDYCEVFYENRLDELSFLSEEELEQIDNKIGYKNGDLYLNDVLKNLRNDFDNMEDFLSENQDVSVELLGYEYDGKPLSDDEKTELKIKYISKYLNNRKYLNGFVDLVMYSDIVMKRIFSKEEQKKVKIYSFFVDENDLKNQELGNILNSSETRKRGRVIKFNGENYIFSLNPDTLKYEDEEWNKIVEENNIFIRPKYPVRLLNHLRTSGADRNIIHNHEFLRLFSKFETSLLKSGKQLEDIQKENVLIQEGTILTRFGNNYISYQIEDGNLAVCDYEKNLKYTVFYEDEGRNVHYETTQILKNNTIDKDIDDEAIRNR